MSRPMPPVPSILNLKLTRAKLESLVEDLVEKTPWIRCRIALKDAGLKAPSEIEEVILVGGQTRMPQGAGSK